MISVLCYTWLLMAAIVILVEPFWFGKPREPYSYWSWLASWLGIAMVLPIVGRALGWW